MKALTKGVRFCASTRIVKTRHVKFGFFPCQNYKSESGAHMPTHANFDMLRQKEKPSKKSKNGGAQGSVAILEECMQLRCVSQDSYPRKSVLRDTGKLGTKRTVKFSKGT